MAKSKEPKNKRAQISEAQSKIMLIVSIATVVSVFCLASSKALLSQANFQRKLINARHESVKQLQANKAASATLIDQYNNVFLDPTNALNLIGGKNDKSSSAVPPDGDNARLVLNALPVTYDYPGLVSSVAKILSSDGIINPSITGTDESATAVSTPSASPKEVQIKFAVSGQGTYANVQKVVQDLERSIRPFDVTSIQLNGTNSLLNFTAQVTTYYQPAKTLDTVIKKVQ